MIIRFDLDGTALPIPDREFDLRGRPQYLVDSGVEPINEVI